jgi:hypothetical protein
VSVSLQRIFLDTNIYILGDANKHSPESQILEACGYRGKTPRLTAEIIFSDELIDQIRRVSKYLYGKQQAGQIIGNLWRWLNIYYVPSTINWDSDKDQLIASQAIPSEDIEIYLSAKYGQADCFVSGNRKLIRTISDFDCFTSAAFINKYLSP